MNRRHTLPKTLIIAALLGSSCALEGVIGAAPEGSYIGEDEVCDGPECVCVGDQCFEPMSFSCEPGARKGVAQPVQHLTQSQYRNTIDSILSYLFTGSSMRANIASEIDAAVSAIPTETGEVAFATMTQGITGAQVDRYVDAAWAMSDAFTANTGRIEAIAGTCATATTPTDTCRDNFISDVGLTILRRPVESADLTLYQEVFNQDPANGVRAVLFAMLLSKDFLYHLRHRGNFVGSYNDELYLTGYELASRMSYHFLGTMPDGALLDAAALPESDPNSLLHNDGFEAQIARLGDPNGAMSLGAQRFFDEWFHIGETNRPASLTSSTQGEQLRSDAIDSIRLFLDNLVKNDKGYDDFLLSRDSFASGELANLYDAPAWSGDPDTPAELSSEKYAGFMTRAVFMFGGNSVLRGARVSREILCRPIPDPDPNLVPGAGALPPDHPTKSRRERYEARTSGSSCIGCHTSIDPYGFAFEHYTGDGEHQYQEIATDGTTQYVHEVNATTQPEILGSYRPIVTNAIELSEAIVKSNAGSACMVQQYFRQSIGREPNLQADGCTLDRLHDALTDDQGGMASMFKKVADDFRTRRFK